MEQTHGTMFMSNSHGVGRGPATHDSRLRNMLFPVSSGELFRQKSFNGGDSVAFAEKPSSDNLNKQLEKLQYLKPEDDLQYLKPGDNLSYLEPEDSMPYLKPEDMQYLKSEDMQYLKSEDNQYLKSENMQYIQQDSGQKCKVDAAGQNNPESRNSEEVQSERQKHCSVWQFCGYKKRPRATYEQLSVLERTFQINSLPDAKIREALSRQLDMKARSIRIWFQNRRAKEKLSKKRATQKLASADPREQHNSFCALPQYAKAPRMIIPNSQISPCPQESDMYALHGAMASQRLEFLAAHPQVFDTRYLTPNSEMSPNGRRMMPLILPCQIVMPVEFSMVGSWEASVMRGCEIYLTLDVSNRSLQLYVLSPNRLYRIMYPVESVFSIHFARFAAASAQVTIKLTTPPVVYTSPREPVSHQAWTPGVEPGGFPPEDSVEQILCGKTKIMRGTLLEFAKSDAHLRAVTFTGPEDPAEVYQPALLERPTGIIPSPYLQQGIDVHSLSPAVSQTGNPPGYCPTPQGHLASKSPYQQVEIQQPPETGERMAQFGRLEPRAQNVLVQ